MLEEILNSGKIEITVNGETQSFDIVLTFECEQNGRTYIGYTDHSLDAEGRENLTFVSVSNEDPAFELRGVYMDYELEMINDVLSDLANQE